MAHEIIRKHLLEIKTAKQYALIWDETSDISRQEQISISVRIVTDDLSVKKIFLGFYATTDTKSDTLFTVILRLFQIQDFLLRFNLNMFDMRGQCYDGASNVSGRLTGLQARIRDIEPRALYVHCVAHKLNLVVQDGLENVLCAKSFIGTVKDLINFIRDSPKRLAIYKNLQSENAPNLSPFCPIRYLNIVSIYTYVQAKRAHFAGIGVMLTDIFLVEFESFLEIARPNSLKNRGIIEFQSWKCQKPSFEKNVIKVLYAISPYIFIRLREKNLLRQY
ncbi:Zinc finger MYM-type protein 1 [Trachymyrmex cornetzi]|uniref:Zinc finger MYM-type protein 1 n=1 Tax=Trachymyrmex cornetzi TaxID=471704 RepID=A0A151JMU5_9HYME|nr:Zinc finger MYM-type protein 1 [Trachymyrmex cornetzi]